MTQIEGLNATITADASQLVREADRGEASVERLERQLKELGKRGVISQRQVNGLTRSIRRNHRAGTGLAGALDRVEQEYLDVGNAASRSAQRVTQTARGFRMARGQLYNFSIQAQDVAVQMSAGTSALTAFSQNLPQLLSTMGPAAAAIGVFVAVLPLAKVGLEGLTGALGDTKKAFEGGIEAVDAYTEALSKTNEGFGDAFDKYIQQIERTSQAMQNLADLAEKQALRALKEMAQAVQQNSTEASLWQKVMMDTDNTVTGNLLNIDTQLQGTLGTWYDAHQAVDRFQGALEDIQDAQGIDALYTAAVKARDIFQETVDVTGEMTDEQELFWQQLNETILTLLRMGAAQKAAYDTGPLAKIIAMQKEYAESLRSLQAKEDKEIELLNKATTARREYAASLKAAAFLQKRATQQRAEEGALDARAQYAETMRQAAEQEAEITRITNAEVAERRRYAVTMMMQQRAEARAEAAARAKETLARAAATADAERILGEQMQEAMRQQALEKWQAEQDAIEETEAYINEMAEVFKAAQKRMRDEDIAETERSLERLFRSRTLLYSIRFAGEEEVMSQPVESSFKMPSYKRLKDLGISDEDISNMGVEIPDGGEGSGASGGGGSGLQGRLEALQQSLMTEEELELASWQKRQEMMAEALDQQLLTRQEYGALMEDAAQQHADRLKKIDVYKYGTGLDKAGAFFGDMANVMQHGNEKMLKIARVFGAAQALISTIQGSAEELKKGIAGIPTAALIMSQGLALVSAIKAVSSTGAAAAGTTGAGAAAPTAAAGAGAGSSVSRQVALQLTGGPTYSRDQVIDLISAINDAVEDGQIVRLVQ